MAVRWWSSVLAVASLAALFAAGCAHSEDEWRAKVREVEGLRARLDREQAQHDSASKARDDAGAKLSKIERELREAGIDPAMLGDNVELQARALEEHRRRAEQASAMRQRLALLRDRLSPLGKERVAVLVRHNRLTIRVAGDALFDAGRDSLRREGRDLLVKIAEVIRSEPLLDKRAFQVIGHVESGRPGGAFKDGLGLSAMRAREVVSLVREPVARGGGGLVGARWSAAGQGDGDPIDRADTPEAKAKNRRCEIVLVPAAEESVDITEAGK